MDARRSSMSLLKAVLVRGKRRYKSCSAPGLLSGRVVQECGQFLRLSVLLAS